MLLLTTAMKPLSARTTPRRLMAPISRHFLPVLQPEPPAWLTTGLMKGSRLPFAAYLLSGASSRSLAAFSPAPLSEVPLPAAGRFSSGGAVGAGSALCPAKTAPPRFARPLFFARAELATGDTDFAGVTTAASLDRARTWVAPGAAGAVW